MFKRAEAWFTGRVQGVYFRDYTRRHSIELRVRGWVMNQDDGSVQAVFEGEENDILEVIRRLREEHPIASVDGVDIRWEDYRGEFKEFQIRYLGR